jgi:hypothetical protein
MSQLDHPKQLGDMSKSLGRKCIYLDLLLSQGPCNFRGKSAVALKELHHFVNLPIIVSEINQFGERETLNYGSGIQVTKD